MQRVKAIKDLTRHMLYNVSGPTANIVVVPQNTTGKIVDKNEKIDGLYEVAFTNGERWWVTNDYIERV
jgi:hypothetical protein